MDTSSLLITPTELAAALSGPRPPRVLDVRWRLDAPDGRAAYDEGHVPGAVYVSLDDELSSHGEAAQGRHPLPSTAELQAAARRWGIDDGDAVVVYDDWLSFGASRAWWVLVDAGVADVRVLDGGWSAWQTAGLEVSRVDPQPARGDVTLSSGHLPQLDADGAAAFPREGMLIDARAGERYRGEVEPIDPRAGHIPGAVNRPATANLDDAGRFRPPHELRAAHGIGDDAVAAYCGSGVSASQTVFALRLAGVDAALYPGSWSQWSNLPGRPVATGVVE